MLLILGCWVALAGCAPPATNLATALNSREVTHITQAQLQVQGEADQPVALPMQQVRSPRVLRRFELRASFAVDRAVAQAGDDLWGVYFVSLFDGGRVRVNGVDVGDVASSTAQTTTRSPRPFLFPIARSLLRNGSNQLDVVWTSRESQTLLPRVVVGPYAQLYPEYQTRLFWQFTMAQSTFVYALVLSAMLMGIYSLRRKERNYLFLGLGSLGCAIVVFFYIAPPMPAALYPYFRLVQNIGIALFTCSVWIFLIRESQPSNRWFGRLCVLLGVAGPLAYLLNYWINDSSYFRAFEVAWRFACGIFGLYPLTMLGLSIARQWSLRKAVFFGSTFVVMVMGILDLVLQVSGRSPYEFLGFGIQSVTPLWFTALSAVLVTDFVASLTFQEKQRALMKARLAQQEDELNQLHEKNKLRDAEEARVQERQRIMQDIHDGLGSQLITSLAMSERGTLDQPQTSRMLRECIDDLRLAIDTTANAQDQFSLALANLRFRTEPRLRAAGIALKWDDQAFPESTVVPASMALPLLRIIQEAITNVLKHARASQITVQLAATAQALQISVSDNGIGFNQPIALVGRGLSNMEKRARNMSATFDISSQAGGGTRIHIQLPLDQQASTATVSGSAPVSESTVQPPLHSVKTS